MIKKILKVLKLKKGFTLVELLATIFILSIIFGIGTYYLINTINNSKEEQLVITNENIKKSARIYSEENSEYIIWQKESENAENSYSCIALKTLVHKGLLKQTVIENNDLPSYIILTKNSTGTIISEKLDNEKFCSDNIVEFPTSKEYCLNPIYSGNNQTITKNISEGKIELKNNVYKNAGNYEITAVPTNGNTWIDGTTSEYKFNCSIQKTFPTLTITPNGKDTEEIKVGTILKAELQSNISGTVEIKSSNKDYATANPANNNYNIVANTKKTIEINPLSTRNTKTIITITVIPDEEYSQNYYSGSTTYTIGAPKKTIIKIPDETYCSNPNYNGSNQSLINQNKSTNGFNLYNTKATEIGNYTITANLKYGYIWDDGTTENKTFKCSIKRPNLTITYNTNGGNSCKPNTKSVTYENTYGDLCIPTKANSMFLGWYTEKNNGTEITKNTIVTKLTNHTIYAHWKDVSCTVSFTGTLGENNWYKTTGNVQLSTTGFKTSDISAKGLTTSKTIEFNNKTSASQGATASTTWYGYIQDIYGNTTTCQKNIKVDTTTPTVSITAKKKTAKTTVSSGSWSNQGLNFTLTAKTTGSSGYTIYYCKDTKNTCTPTTKATSGIEITEYNTINGTYYIRYYIKGGSGLQSNINSYTAKVDTTKPTVSITAKKKNAKTTVNSGTTSDEGLNFTLTAGTTGSSGYTIYYCKDTKNTCTPTTKATSGKEITEYNTITGAYYIRYYIKGGSGLSSSVGSYKANIVVCSEENPLGCQKLYLCKFESKTSTGKTDTYIRSTPHYYSDNSSKDNTIGHIFTGEIVYRIPEENPENSSYYRVYIPVTKNVTLYNDNNSTAIFGYIDADCLSTTKLTSPDATCQSKCIG